MAFEDQFDELDRLLLTKSPDYERMRTVLQAIRQTHEIARLLGPAQDNLYASIARSHRQALVHLEAGDTAAARQEMADALAWFMRRFQGLTPEALAKCPKVADELQAARELAVQSQTLREAVGKNTDTHAR